MKKLKEKGITLIALVITIIVLLILAGVSIAALSGQNGILTKAGEAKTKTELASIEEARALTQIEAATNTNGTIFKGTTTESGTSKEVEVKIPSGFAVSQVEGENLIDNGLVIIDTNGNEFVWVPCTEVEYTKKRDTNDGWMNKQYEYTNKNWSDTKNYDTRLQSIKDNEGFYIARYEAGIPENATEIYANTDGATYTKNDKKNQTTYTPGSKKGLQAWNLVSQTNSKILAEKMITNSSAKSYLVDGNAWDVVCRKMSETKNVLDSTSWGNYYNNTTTAYDKLNTLFALHNANTWGSIATYSKGQVTGAPIGTGSNRLELSTGASDDFKAYNIYDIAGNMWEWTTEEGTIKDNSNTKIYAVRRGGSFHDNGSGHPAVFSYGVNGVGVCSINIGFRVALYL